MSDRIAVFDEGRIQQVGPPAMIYERPATEFVAGFVGTSNLLRAEAAQKVLGEFGTFMVRPEKIRVVLTGDAVGDGEDSATGIIREVVYVGSATRFLVDLDAGATLMALQQNLDRSSSDVADLRGQRVTLAWRKEHEYRLA